MRLLELKLRNYRNYARLDLEPGPGLNLFLGRNGQGKTNLLEAVAMLALSSSPRARRDSDLIGPLASEARVWAAVESGGARREIEISIKTSGSGARRTIQVAGLNTRAVDLPGTFRVTLFWPDDLSLVKSGPEFRRRLLNQMLVQVEPGYARALTGYARVIEQRNSLLKKVAGHFQGRSALEVWDIEMARLGEEIAGARRRAVEALEGHAVSCHREISAGEDLELAYQGPPLDLLGAVQNSLPEDLRRGSTSVGPHRDDIEVKLGGRDARAHASQGQQRTAAISLKLAEAAVVAERTGEPPVLLLDDVLSELDAGRRRALLARVGLEGQVVITSVEMEPFPASLVARAAVGCIEAGVVTACG